MNEKNIFDGGSKAKGKPEGSKIEKVSEVEKIIRFLFPRKKNEIMKSQAIGVFFGAVLMGYLVFRDIMSPNQEDLGGFLITVPVGLVCLLYSGISFASLLKRTSLTLSPQKLTLQHSVLGLSYSQQISSINLYITEWRSENTHEVILCSENKVLRFGSNLTLAECRWLQREIREYIAQHSPLIVEEQSVLQLNRVTKMSISENSFRFRLPGKILNRLMFVLLCMLAGVSWLATLLMTHGNAGQFSAFWLIALMLGIGICITLLQSVKVMFPVVIELTPQQIRICGGFGGPRTFWRFNISRSLSSVTEIKITPQILRNGQELPQITLHTKSSTPLLFGFWLTRPESEWLVREIQDYLSLYSAYDFTQHNAMQDNG
ncbi:MAG: hypothetical protein GY801_40670 [bacterium]|nr:hypothetical protein [bacterium]